MAQVKHGIQIWTSTMNTVTIDVGGKTATIGPGVPTKKVTDTLGTAEKQTGKSPYVFTSTASVILISGVVTGVCECTGLMGPALGGGHGLLQGHYGLVADQIVEARVVLASGQAVTVSAASNPDLFYAPKGAGHNFGVVTSLKIKIYDVADTGACGRGRA